MSLQVPVPHKAAGNCGETLMNEMEYMPFEDVLDDTPLAVNAWAEIGKAALLVVLFGLIGLLMLVIYG